MAHVVGRSGGVGKLFALRFINKKTVGLRSGDVLRLVTELPTATGAGGRRWWREVAQWFLDVAVSARFGEGSREGAEPWGAA